MIRNIGMIVRSMALAVSALTVVVITAGPRDALAKGQIPFKASYSGSINPPHGPPPVALTGSGMASKLGASTNQGTITPTGPASSCPNTGFAVENDETLTSTEAGDQITIVIHDQSCPISPGVYHGVGTYVVTGGTGPLAGATGGGTFDGHGDFNQGTFSLTFNGTISQPAY